MLKRCQHLPDFIINIISPVYSDVTPSYDPTPDQSLLIATFSALHIMKKSVPRLHTSKTNWQQHCKIINEQSAPKIRQKTPSDIKMGTTDLVKIPQLQPNKILHAGCPENK